MRLPLRRISSSLGPARFACGLGVAVVTAAGVQAQIQVPLPQVLSEADTQIKARKPADAAPLLDMVLARAEKGEALPSGVSLSNVQLLAANTNFQLQNFARAEEIATAMLKTTTTGQAAADGRLVLGLSLALQKKFAEAVPVFQALEESPVYRDKALMYRSMAAQQANQPEVAIDALNRLLASAPRDADWADSALTLIALQLQQKNPDAARRGLELLRGSMSTVDNLAGLNVLSLQLGDTLLGSNDLAGALTAYRTVLPRSELLRMQKQRTARMESQLARQKSMFRGSVTDADSVRRIEARIKATKEALDEISKRADYDATLFYRLGHTFLLRGGAWESAIVLERLLKEYPQAEERELAYSDLVRAYADSGRVDRMRTALDDFMRAIPESKLLPQALYVAAQTAFDRGRADLQLEFLEVGVNKFPDAELTEFMVLMQANAHFAGGKFDEARADAEKYVAKYPQGRFAEDATYLRAMATLVLGRAGDAIKEINEYIAKYPEGRFVADGRYRIAAAQYAMQDYAAAEKQLDAWLADFPVDHAQRGEALSTQGDVYAGEGRIDDAIASYRAAMSASLSDDQLGYVLDELTKHYQSKRDYNTAAVMWEDFARERPDHPFVINAAYWIGRLRGREGKPDVAITQMGEIARRYLTDPNRDAVERLLTQMAALLARNPRPGPDGVRPPAPSNEEIAARVEKELVTDATKHQDTVKARVLFTEAEVASLRKNPALRDELLSRIGDEIAPEALPPGLLGRVGDLLRQQGKLDRARACYDQLVLRYPRSMYADFGYVGLGELAYLAGDYDNALIHFTNAIDRAGARFKLLEATLGRAKTLLAAGKLDESKELFEQIASNRAWRGEATAQSIYSLGEILLKRGASNDLAQAQAHFQRVFISYKKFTPWVARAYLRSGETFEKQGQPKEALATYREMIRNRDRFESYPELGKALERAKVLELQVPDSPAAAATTTGGAS
ncbi:tetratricopeptide repeat protein [Rariglobus hedericola]|nr:tetratricopeptide repeat protein [Rariglobus hedericola]